MRQGPKRKRNGGGTKGHLRRAHTRDPVYSTARRTWPGMRAMARGMEDVRWCDDEAVHTSSRLLCFFLVSVAGLIPCALMVEFETGDAGGL